MADFWLNPFRRQGDGFVGRLDNVPRWTRDLREGDYIPFKQTDIIDWLFMEGDTMRGNFTGCAINAIRSPNEAPAMQQRFKMSCE